MYNTIKFKHLKKVEGDIYFYKKDMSMYMRINKCLICGMTRLDNIDGNGKSIYVIVHNKHYNDLPSYIKRFMIQHEVGHVKCGHEPVRMENKHNFIYRMISGDFTEFQADWYSFTKVGCDAVKSLRWMTRNYKKIKGACISEILPRYVYMVSKIMWTYIKLKVKSLL